MGSVEEDLIRQLQIDNAGKIEREAEKADEKSKSWYGKLGAAGLIFMLLWKFKALALIALSKLKFLLLGAKFLGFGKMLLSGGSMALSVVLYATQWGFPYALGFVLLILIHEMGHVLALKYYRIKASMPLFIPFLGAFVALKEMPKNARIEAYVALAGPFLGTLGALLCHALYLYTKAPLFLALAYAGYFINLFNLIPVSPLDGGRVAAAVSPVLWFIGIAISIFILITKPNFILFIIVLLCIPRLLSFIFKKHKDSGPPEEGIDGKNENEDYYNVPAGTRIAVAALYFGLASLLGILSIESHTMLQAMMS